MNGTLLLGRALRLDDKLLEAKLKEYDLIYKDDTHNTKWNKYGLIDTNIDGDDITDYMVLTMVEPTPFMEGNYKIFGITGKDFKCYSIESFSLFVEDFNEYVITHGETKIEANICAPLPYIIIEKMEGVNTFYIQRNPLEEVYNPYYFDTDNNKFDILAYD